MEFVLEAAFQNAADQSRVMSKIEAKLRILPPPVNGRDVCVKNQRLAYTSGIYLMGNLSAAD